MPGPHAPHGVMRKSGLRMKVSVAMCTYNGERFLQEQLESIAEQTYAPAELVVCDDGSSDGTIRVLEAFRQNAGFPVRLVRNETTLGSTGNFAQAIALCTGEAIALCDQDDRWAPEKLAVAVQALQADPSVSGVFSNAWLMDENGDRLPGDLWGRVRFNEEAQRSFRKTGPHYLVRRDTVTGAAFVFRAALAGQLLPIPQEWVHDGWIAFVLAALSRIDAAPAHLITYRLHQAQQVGAAVVPLHAHLNTRRDDAVAFHQKMVRRWTVLAERLDGLASQGWRVDREIVLEVERKIKFEQARLRLLEQPAMRRIVPALALLSDYRRYEKGTLSLLRDLTHAG